MQLRFLLQFLLLAQHVSGITMHLVGILFPHINDDARSKPHQIIKYLILKLSYLPLPYSLLGRNTRMFLRSLLPPPTPQQRSTFILFLV